MTFINQFPKMTDKQFEESVYRATQYLVRERTKKIALVYLLAVIIYGLLTKYIIGTIFLLAFSSFILILFITVFVKFPYRTLVKRREALKTPENSMNRVVIDDQLSIYRNETLMSTSDIKQIKISLETENFFVLIMKGETIVQLEKNSFLEGTEEGFRKWLEEQGIRNK